MFNRETAPVFIAKLWRRKVSLIRFILPVFNFLQLSNCDDQSIQAVSYGRIRYAIKGGKLF